MKVTQRTLLAMSAALVFGLGACSDDDDTVTPSTDKNYYPTTSGSYWVYESRSIDSTGTQSEVMSTDSTYANGTKTIGGKTAVELITKFNYEGTAPSYDTTYTYSQNSEIYNYFSGDFFGAVVTPTWVKSADFKSTAEWTAMNQELPPVELPTEFTGGVEVTATPKFTMKGQKSGATKSIAFEGKTMAAQEIITTTGVSLSNLIVSGFPTGQSMTFDIITKAYFVENIGMVQSITEPTTITLPLGQGGFTMEGSSQLLVRHNIK